MRGFAKIKEDTFYKDLLITFVGQFVVMFLSFLMNKIISNYFSIEDYGIYNIIRRIVSVVTYVMIMALGIAIPKYIAEAKAKRDEIQVAKYYNGGMFIVVLASMVMAILLMVFKDGISYMFFAEQGYDHLMFPIIVYSIGSTLITYAYSYYRGINAFVKYNVINIVMQIIQIIVLFVINDSLYHLFWGWGILLIIYGLLEIICTYVRGGVEFSKACIDIKAIKELLIYSIPRVPGEFVLFAYSLIPLTIISNKFSLGEVGLFSAALSINSLITPLFSLVGTILLPLVSKSVALKNNQDVKQKINLLAGIYLFVSGVAITFIYLFGELVIVILYSREYLDSLPLVKILIIAIIPNAFYLLLRNPLDGISRMPYNTMMLVLSFIVYVVLLVLAPTVEYCAYATIIAYVILGGGSFIIWKLISKHTL